jgi:hypothetical protein
MRLLLVAVLSMSILAACAGHQGDWSMVGGPQLIEHEGIEVDWPRGWMKFTAAGSNEQAGKEGWILTVTRDGVVLQAMTLKKRSLEQGFTNTQKKAAPDISPQELAELVVDDLRANPHYHDIQVIEHSPTTLDGDPGYKVVIRYRSKAGLHRQAVHYGCIHTGLLYMLSYDAPQRHYYALDLPTFEAVKNSLKWKVREVLSSRHI